MAADAGNWWQASLPNRRRGGREVCVAHSDCDHAIVVRATRLLSTWDADPVPDESIRQGASALGEGRPANAEAPYVEGVTGTGPLASSE